MGRETFVASQQRQHDNVIELLCPEKYEYSNNAINNNFVV